MSRNTGQSSSTLAKQVPETISRRSFIARCTAGALIPAFAGGGLSLFDRRPRLVVWSCGGNHHLLLDFNHWFERRHDCRITYASAPVEHLISVLVRRAENVDVLVGRSGPGWNDLTEAGRLATPQQLFALDPYVIIVPKGNPGRINNLADLKRSDIKTVYSPTASGPSGKVVQYLLQAADRVIEPGISAAYAQKAVEAFDCGWKVFPAVAEGHAHASVVRLSMTTAPETQGTVETILIPPSVMAAMTEGQGAIPQRVAILNHGGESQLARLYVDALVGATGLDFCRKHGYIHILAPDVDRWQALFKKQRGSRDGKQTGMRGGKQPERMQRGRGRQSSRAGSRNRGKE